MTTPELERGSLVSQPYDAERLAKEMVRTVLGEHNNEYLERLMIRQLKGERKIEEKSSYLPSSKMEELEEIRKNLNVLIQNTQKCAIDRLSQTSLDCKKLDHETIKHTSALVLETVMCEKIKDRLEAINSDRWKKLMGVLTLILPIVSSLVTFLLTKYSKSS